LFDRPGIATDFGLWKDHADEHVQILLSGLKMKLFSCLTQADPALDFCPIRTHIRIDHLIRLT
ncbi:MAG: hypothetical protein ACREQ2_18605, partial [Candidatus Binatia bacterium]